MAAPGPYSSTHPLPIPITGPPYGGSAQSPVNFWNSSLSENDTVCSVDWKDIMDSCCPWAIGIRSNTVQGCRMQATVENIAFFENCTRQIWGEVTNRSQDAVPSCVPFMDKLRNQEEVATAQLRRTAGYGLICGTVGALQRPFNFTALCCDQLGGRRIYKNGVGFGAFNKSWVESCDIMQGQELQWNSCIRGYHTYPACAERDKAIAAANSAASGLRSHIVDLGFGAVVAAASLAALV